MRKSLLLALGASLLVLPARSHEATNVQGQPTGWKYPWACCSNMDCRAVDKSVVNEGPDGITIVGSADKAPISYGDSRVKDSPDGEYHVCAHQSGTHAGETICVFIPPKGF